MTASPASATASGTTTVDGITMVATVAAGGLVFGPDVTIPETDVMDVTTIEMIAETTTEGTMIAGAAMGTTTTTYAFFRRAKTRVD
jgi:hypothetical protein